MQTALYCTIMRGGTAKGLFFLKDDLPSDVELRDKVLIAAIGAQDRQQIDGIGGADSPTTKVVVVSGSSRADADVDYYLLQVEAGTKKIKDNIRSTINNIQAEAFELRLKFMLDPVVSP